jgi:hypothetical protein
MEGGLAPASKNVYYSVIVRNPTPERAQAWRDGVASAHLFSEPT